MIQTLYYTVKRIADEYYVENISQEELQYVVNINACTTSEEEVVAGIIAIGQQVVIKLSVDSQYSLKITGTFPEQKTITINHYPYLRSLLIKQIEKALCKECNCSNTSNCLEHKYENCTLLVLAIGNINIYKDFITPLLFEGNGDDTYVNTLIHTYIQETKCTLHETLCKVYVDLSITGFQNVDYSIIKTYIAILYLALRAYELTNSIDETNTTFINEVYKYSIIKDCLKKLNIDICLFDSLVDIQNNMYLQNNIAPTVDNTIVELMLTDDGNYSYDFSLLDFTNRFFDINGDSYGDVTIEEAPQVGTLTYNNAPINSYPLELSTSSLNLLEYTVSFAQGQTTDNLDFIPFRIKDDNVSPLQSNLAKILFKIVKENVVVTNCLNDVNFDIRYGETLVLTSQEFIDNFTTSTGSVLSALRVSISNLIPIELKLNGVTIQNQQVLNFADVINGLVTADLTVNANEGTQYLIPYQATIDGGNTYISDCSVSLTPIDDSGVPDYSTDLDNSTDF